MLPFTMETWMQLITLNLAVIAAISFIVLWRRSKIFLNFLFMRKKLVPYKDGGKLVAEILKEHQVKHLFTLIGGHISPIICAAEKAGIDIIDTRHEVTAVFAADAVARLTGNIGVAVVTAGPGVTNTVTAVKNAQMSQSPVLLIGGAAPTLLKGRGALQDIDQLSLFKSLCKYTKSVCTVRDIKPVLRKAIQVAMSNTPGPVFVEFPVDVLYPLDVVQKEVMSSKGGKSLFSKLVNWYLDWHIYNIFIGDFNTEDTKGPLPIEVPLASKTQVQKCFELLSQAKRPVMILGSQVMTPVMNIKAMKKAVHRLQIPCFLGGMSRGLLGRNNLLHLRHTRKDVLKEADLVILAGAICDFRLSYGKILSKSSKVVIINRSKEQMLQGLKKDAITECCEYTKSVHEFSTFFLGDQNTDMFWKPTLAIQGCVSDFLVRLAKLKVPPVSNEWIIHVSNRDRDKGEVKNKCAPKSVMQLDPVDLLHKLESALSDDTILIADGGDFVATASYIVKPSGPLKWLDPGPFGTLGCGAGFALGAKLCDPNADVVILYGDGSFGYSLIEFDTFSRHKLPVVALVGNDACWSQIAREQVPLFGSTAACCLDYSDYHVAVEGIGGKGVLLRADDKENLLETFRIVLQKSRREGCSILLNAHISRSSFREGSISV